MKAIYINLDPYLAAFAAWLKGGKVGPAPHVDPLPLAVTIPLGEEAALLIPGVNGTNATYQVDDVALITDPTGSSHPGESELTTDRFRGLSRYPAADEDFPQDYTVRSLAGGSTTLNITISDTDETASTSLAFTVLVRRESASGPVDLVDFTPPAAAPSAADIKSALVEAGDGALAGVSLGGAILVTLGDGMQVSEATQIGEAGPLIQGSDVETALGVGSASA